MNSNEKKYDLTDFAAWWGAAIATLLAATQLYSFVFSGVQISIDITSNRDLMYGEIQIPNVVLVEVSNNGSEACTIKNLGYQIKNSEGEIIQDKLHISSGVYNPLPHKLEPGSYWLGYLPQTPELESYIKTGNAYVSLFCSDSKKPYTQKITVTHNKSSKKDAQKARASS
ncbi:MAG: hypothetical protein R3189_04550 [Thiomicrorhabdus chilensis]|uniref:hypothetical protein n=1 Tax=Thiomicrorhabdus chilensis TaxID=63656 RepID=UPI00299E99CD|nr:hypothetical protein [Thiomicrorhabdus chilensis]MDX1347505.1 hypothetical protein [Thiomicrorhabdus chilensis]